MAPSLVVQLCVFVGIAVLALGVADGRPAITSMHADPTLGHAGNKHVMACHAQQLLAQSVQPHRLPKRAALGSTFGQYLSRSSASCATATGPSPLPPSLLLRRGVVGAGGATAYVSPIDFGADPSGRNDSTAAFEAAVQHLLLHNFSGATMANGIANLNGATLELGGGSYLIGQPIVIPAMVGNLRIAHGMLKATASFPQARFLIEAGESVAACKKRNSASCNENLAFEDLFLDGSGVARGCLQVNSTMGANLGPDLFFLGFNRTGLSINGGHECMLHESWFGTHYYGPNGPKNSTTAIDLLGNDHVVSDVIVFSAETGLFTDGGANVIEGLHTWNDATERGGRGIVVSAESTRLDLVYLDYNALVLIDPVHVSVTSGFFLGMGNLVLQAGPAGSVDGLFLLANTYNNFNMPVNDTIVVDERQGTFKTVRDLVQVGTVAPPDKFSTKSTHCHQQQRLANATQWTFDFSDCLLFTSKGIEIATHSLVVEEGSANPFARHMLRHQGLNATVVTDQPVTATVRVCVAQGAYDNGNGPC